ncbi:hypothetical protein [Bradyrhizobium sp. WSM1743]|nr:hypothetical protein [Bradyrhizobium sp. WSM1743]
MAYSIVTSFLFCASPKDVARQPVPTIPKQNIARPASGETVLKPDCGLAM